MKYLVEVSRVCLCVRVCDGSRKCVAVCTSERRKVEIEISVINSSLCQVQGEM